MNNKGYQKKIDEVKMIACEVEAVAAIQSHVEFLNKHVMKSGILRLSLEEA